MLYHDSITSLSGLKVSVECHVRNISKFMLPTKVAYKILSYRARFANFSTLIICSQKIYDTLLGGGF